MVNDSIADLLTRIRNAQRAGHKTVRADAFRMSGMILDVLKSEGFIDSFSKTRNDESGFEEYEVFLKYFSNGEPMIRECRRVSTPGKRVYSGTEDLPKVKQGLGLTIVSTPEGVLSDREARRRKIGGEVLAIIG